MPLEVFNICFLRTFEPPHDKTYKMAWAPSEDSDQPGHPPSLIRVFAVRMKKAWVLSYPLSAQERLWSDWADAQADLSPRWVHILLVLSWGGSFCKRLRLGCMQITTVKPDLWHERLPCFCHLLTTLVQVLNNAEWNTVVTLSSCMGNFKGITCYK